MAAVLKKARIGLAGGRRIDISEMAKDAKSREELEELLLLMEEIEADESRNAEDRSPETAESPPKRSVR